MSDPAPPWLAQLARGALPAELAARPRELLPIVLRWWKVEAKRGSLDTPQAELAAAILALPLVDPDTIELAADLVAAFPKHLVYRLRAVLARTRHLGPAFAAALRARVRTGAFPARVLVIDWLLEHGSLELPDDARLLLAAREPRLRELAVTWLDKLPADALAPLGDALAAAAAADRRQTVRRGLAALARRAATAGPAAPAARTPAQLAAEVVVSWDAGGGRPRARARIAELLAGGPLALAELVRLARSAAAPTLRRELEARLAGTHDADLDAAVAAAATTPERELTRADAAMRAAWLERAMVDQRPIARPELAAMLRGRRPLAVVVADAAAATDRWLAVPAQLDDGAAAGPVVIVHPALASYQELSRWHDELAARHAAQPFEQLARASALVPADLRTATELALDAPEPRYAYALWRRGWAPDLGEAEELVEWYASTSASYRTFPAWQVTARWSHFQTALRGPDHGSEDAPDSVGETVRFTAADGRVLPLGEVPAIAFSETARDLSVPNALIFRRAATAAPTTVTPIRRRSVK